MALCDYDVFTWTTTGMSWCRQHTFIDGGIRIEVYKENLLIYSEDKLVFRLRKNGFAQIQDIYIETFALERGEFGFIAYPHLTDGKDFFIGMSMNGGISPERFYCMKREMYRHFNRSAARCE